MSTLISKTGLARKLDVDPRTLDRVLSVARIAPDFVNGSQKLFHVTRVKSIREQIREGR